MFCSDVLSFTTNFVTKTSIMQWVSMNGNTFICLRDHAYTGESSKSIKSVYAYWIPTSFQFLFTSLLYNRRAQRVCERKAINAIFIMLAFYTPYMSNTHTRTHTHTHAHENTHSRAHTHTYTHHCILIIQYVSSLRGDAAHFISDSRFLNSHRIGYIHCIGSKHHMQLPLFEQYYLCLPYIHISTTKIVSIIRLRLCSTVMVVLFPTITMRAVRKFNATIHNSERCNRLIILLSASDA